MVTEGIGRRNQSEGEYGMMPWVRMRMLGGMLVLFTAVAGGPRRDKQFSFRCMAWDTEAEM